MFKSERTLAGLFSGFKLQSQGATPHLIEEEIRPSLDLNLWAMQSWDFRTRHIPGAAVGVVLGDFGTFIPQSPVLVVGACIELFCFLAGDGGEVAVTVRRPQASAAPFTLAHLDVPPVTAAQLARKSVSVYLAQPLWVSAQSLFAINSSRVDGAPTCWGQLLVYQPAIDT